MKKLPRQNQLDWDYSNNSIIEHTSPVSLLPLRHLVEWKQLELFWIPSQNSHSLLWYRKMNRLLGHAILWAWTGRRSERLLHDNNLMKDYYITRPIYFANLKKFLSIRRTRESHWHYRSSVPSSPLTINWSTSNETRGPTRGTFNIDSFQIDTTSIVFPAQNARNFSYLDSRWSISFLFDRNSTKMLIVLNLLWQGIKFSTLLWKFSPFPAEFRQLATYHKTWHRH